MDNKTTFDVINRQWVDTVKPGQVKRSYRPNHASGYFNENEQNESIIKPISKSILFGFSRVDAIKIAKLFSLNADEITK